MRSAKLISAVLYLGQNKLEAVVEDCHGSRRKVNVNWLTKEPTDVPPDHWFEIVLGEVDLQISDESRILDFKVE